MEVNFDRCVAVAVDGVGHALCPANSVEEGQPTEMLAEGPAYVSVAVMIMMARYGEDVLGSIVEGRA